MEPIAIVGMACRYPDANTPAELWENALAQRRAFRRIPSLRLRLGDYFSSDHSAPDRVYSLQAAVLEGYEFDRVRFRISGSTYRAVDIAHWLALDVGSDALEDAGFPDGDGLPRETTGVLVGNTLTGEISRANLLRLRWPYVSRLLQEALSHEGWDAQRRKTFLDALEDNYKAPFPAINEESLAGGLSNTIAGRICNYFDLKGTGYTVDGACASSLLAVVNACSALVCGDFDVALAGGVDVSLDPFELVGFAKLGALATDEMYVFDSRSAGFIPGEGCGFVVLMRHSDAVAQNRHIYALIPGWGLSSDGNGGITRPEVAGQLLALQRAYRRAQWGIETAEYFEGHGTGTTVGDATELRTLSLARRQSNASGSAAIGSIKANIGHTKAAAGIAGLIKAALVLEHQILPPTTGCAELHPEMAGESPALRTLRTAEPWPTGRQLRAGVSAMGFGGINAHVALEGDATERVQRLSTRDQEIASSVQDCELFLFAGRNWNDLRRQLKAIAPVAPGLSLSGLADLSAYLAANLGSGAVRAAVVASSPTELAGAFENLTVMNEADSGFLHARPGVVVGRHTDVPIIGFAFPGQGTPFNLDGGIFRHRFSEVRDLYERNMLPTSGDQRSTEVAQPGIVGLSVAALRLLRSMGVEADVAIGHSLGEVTALHWAGALNEETLLRIAAARGLLMAKLAQPGGAMASLTASQSEVATLIKGSSAVIAGVNGPKQTVVSGDGPAISAIVESAQAKGIHAVALQVSCAFHSPLMEPVIPAFRSCLRGEKLGEVECSLASTVTGNMLTLGIDVEQLLCDQVTRPVLFTEAARAAAQKGVTLWVEVGPGHVLSRMLAELGSARTVSIDSGGTSLRSLLEAVGTLFVYGTKIDLKPLFAGRFTRPFDPQRQPKFISNPCEQAPAPSQLDANEPVALARQHAPEEFSPPEHESPLEVVRALVARRAELPESAVQDQHRLLSDLHLNSIAVGQVVVEAAKALGLATPADVTNYADASLAEIARALQQWQPASRVIEAAEPLGLESWTRAFTVRYVERASRPHRSDQTGGAWTVLPLHHPLAESLQQALDRQPAGGGVMVCLPTELDDSMPNLLLQAASLALRGEGPQRVIVVQPGSVGGAFLRSLHMEMPSIATCVVRVPFDHPRACEWVLQEAFAAEGHSEVSYDERGTRTQPFLYALTLSPTPSAASLTHDDVLLITGGGKGIAAECGLKLATALGVGLLLMGRSDRSLDPVLQMNLKRHEAAGINFHYVSGDVTNFESTQRAIKEGEAALGPVTALLHAAGANTPRPISALDMEIFRSTLAPKVDGLRNVLSIVDPDRLRMLITFGSLIARTGFQGEADYALANEWMTHLTEDWQAKHPRCRCLAIEWSAWSGIGMGAQVANTEVLRSQGISLIPPESGTEFLLALLCSETPVSVVASSRFGNPKTLQMERPPLPFLRFLEKARVFYPGVELVVDARVTLETDPYIEDHELHGERILPAVMGLEQIAQTAMTVAGSSVPPIFENVELLRPIVVGDGSTVRAVALMRGLSHVEVALRADGTDYSVNHFRAVCSFEGTSDSFPIVHFPKSHAPIPLNPARDLYGSLLFQGPRFQCLRHYTYLSAGACAAELAPTNATWFARYLPDEFILGHPGVRDAAIHALQACIPHQRVLPVGVDRIVISQTAPQPPITLSAVERVRERNNFVYDLELKSADGRICETWEGLRLRSVESLPVPDNWPIPLLGPFIERRLHEWMPGCGVTAAITRSDGENGRGEATIRHLLLDEISVLRRADGKPDLPFVEISASHAEDVTMAISGPSPVGCDLEFLRSRSPVLWKDLLGPNFFSLAVRLAKEAGEDQDAAASRVWTALESLKKAGASRDIPLILTCIDKGGWVRLSGGPWNVTTLVAGVQGCENRLAIATAMRSSVLPITLGARRKETAPAAKG